MNTSWLIPILISTFLLKTFAIGLPKFLSEAQQKLPYTTKFASIRVDHFDVTNTDTFSLKYLINDSYKKNDGSPSPLFFYTGNEGTIEGFAENTGILLDIAPLFNAIVVFAEHRYYGNGTSMPFGQDSFYNATNVRLLTIEQTLADYAQLIRKLKTQYPISRVIASGGSYGGMLSAWFRQKYPDVVDGAYAASAPLAYFRNSGIPYGAFDAVTKNTMQRFGCSAEAVVEAFQYMDLWPEDGYYVLETVFNVDTTKSPLKTKDDMSALKNYIREAFEYMAMTGYPYPTNFLVSLEAWPFKRACLGLQKAGQYPNDAVKALKSAIDVYYGNDTKTCFNATNCGDAATANLGAAQAWTWQSCTEIVIDICAQGPPNDVFWVDCAKNRRDVPNFETYTRESCYDLKYSILNYSTEFIKFDYIKNTFGFDLSSASNIILTHGALDPWSSGIKPLISGAIDRQIYSYLIDGAAHHLDLFVYNTQRLPNTCDPPTVTNARYQIVGILKCWIESNSTDDCDPTELQWPLPSWDGPTDTKDCKSVQQGYPWQQTTEKPTATSMQSTTPFTGSGTTPASTQSVASTLLKSTPTVSPATTKGAGHLIASTLLIFATAISLNGLYD
ncbi:hypothetical protein M3Y98_01006300 [Aphelenchoides besseyi]|nr:hypothetical protein M3Y98_01006300 [Aphelenchoides besseyi]